MKKAIVLGATGGMGYSLVNELVRRRIDVVAFARTEEKLNRLFGQINSVSVYSGDAEQRDDLIRACQGADVIFHSVSVPYPDWSDKHPP